MFNIEFLSDYEGKAHTATKINNTKDLDNFMTGLLETYSKMQLEIMRGDNKSLFYEDPETGLNSKGMNVFENGLFFQVNNRPLHDDDNYEDEMQYAVFAFPSGILGFPITVDARMNPGSVDINRLKIQNMLAKMGKEIKQGNALDKMIMEGNEKISIISDEDFLKQQADKINYILKMLLESKTMTDSKPQTEETKAEPMNFEPISPINIEIPKFDNDGITR